MKISLYRLFLFISFVWVLSACSPIAKDTYLMTNNDFPVYLKPTEGLHIVKIDKQMVDIRPLLSKGSTYAFVALEKGRHRIIVNLTFFDKGSIYYLDVDLESGHSYLIKHALERTSMMSHKWNADVWVENENTGQRVSRVIRNL